MQNLSHRDRCVRPRTMTISRTLAVLCVFASWIQTAHANEPLPLNIAMQSIHSFGKTMVHIENREAYAVNIALVPGRLSSLQYDTLQLRLESGEAADRNLGDPGYLPGVQVFHLESQVTNDAGEQIGPGPSLYEPLWVDTLDIKKISYNEAFVDPSRTFIEGQGNNQEGIDLGGGYTDRTPMASLAFTTGAVDPAIATQVYDAPSPLVMASLKPFQLPDGADLSGGAVAPFGGMRAALLPETVAGIEAPRALVAKGIRGQFSLLLPGGNYRAAWGWVVRAWHRMDFEWQLVGWAYVNGDGTWEIPFPSSAGIGPLHAVRVEYRAGNRFIQIQDEKANVYTWADTWPITDEVTNIGHRAANLTANGNLPGVDVLYVGATNLWVKFYNNGMNPLRDAPIPVTYPNTDNTDKTCKRYDKPTDKNVAWSCFHRDNGAIWAVPEHAAAPTVIQHELGHSINAYFWKTKWPSLGGDHDLTSCANNGLALVEGWATFLAAWVQFATDEPNPVLPYYNLNVETPPANTCMGQTAETRVTTTFWDTYDYWNDGSGNSFDSLIYTSPATSVAIYLNNYKDKAADYLDVMKAGQSTYWQGEFTRLYRLNTIIQ